MLLSIFCTLNFQSTSPFENSYSFLGTRNKKLLFFSLLTISCLSGYLYVNNTLKKIESSINTLTEKIQEAEKVFEDQNKLFLYLKDTLKNNEDPVYSHTLGFFVNNNISTGEMRFCGIEPQNTFDENLKTHRNNFINQLEKNQKKIAKHYQQIDEILDYLTTIKEYSNQKKFLYHPNILSTLKKKSGELDSTNILISAQNQTSFHCSYTKNFDYSYDYENTTLYKKEEYNMNQDQLTVEKEIMPIFLDKISLKEILKIFKKGKLILLTTNSTVHRQKPKTFLLIPILNQYQYPYFMLDAVLLYNSDNQFTDKNMIIVAKNELKEIEISIKKLTEKITETEDLLKEQNQLSLYLENKLKNMGKDFFSQTLGFFANYNDEDNNIIGKIKFFDIEPDNYFTLTMSTTDSNGNKFIKVINKPFSEAGDKCLCYSCNFFISNLIIQREQYHKKIDEISNYLNTIKVDSNQKKILYHPDILSTLEENLGDLDNFIREQKNPRFKCSYIITFQPSFFHTYQPGFSLYPRALNDDIINIDQKIHKNSENFDKSKKLSFYDVIELLNKGKLILLTADYKDEQPKHKTFLQIRKPEEIAGEKNIVACQPYTESILYDSKNKKDENKFYIDENKKIDYAYTIRYS